MSLWSVLENDSTLIEAFEGSVHGIKHSLPPPIVLRDVKITEFQREMVACRVCRDDPMENNALNMCYTEGWLHAELTQDGQVVYVFPTKLHRRIMEHKLSLDILPFPRKQFPTIMDLVVSALSHFKPAALQKRRGVLGMLRSPRTSALSLFPTDGYEGLGDLLTSSSNTLIGPLNACETGKTIDEHIVWFEEQGARCRKWVDSGEISDYVVLDFRTSPPQQKQTNEKLYHVIFAEDFTSYELFTSDLDLIEKSALQN